MKQSKLNDQGIAHYLMIVMVVVAIGVIGAFVVVYKHHNSTKASQTTTNNSSSNSSQSQDKLSDNVTSANGVTSKPKSSSNAQPSSSSNSSSTKTNTSSSSKSSTKSSQTPLSVLTAIITSLQNGGSANVTAHSVTVAGPVTDATARPIVFTANGKTYFAYKQGSGANFSDSASSIANSMAITVAGSKPATVPAHVDKAGNLVDPDSMAVGYSTY